MILIALRFPKNVNTPHHQTIQTTGMENHINNSPQQWISNPRHTQYKEKIESQKTATTAKTPNLNSSA
jgi:hypothetical protein